MEPRLTPATRLDYLDVESFRAMLESAPFEMFLKRLRREYERARQTCATENDPVALRRAQGAAQAWQVALALPEQLLADLKAAAGGKRRSVE